MPDLNEKMLFWDVEKVDYQKNEKFVIERILNFGDENDFHWAIDFYGKEKIKNIVAGSKNLDKKSLFFWCQFFNLNQNKCLSDQSANKQSLFWNKLFAGISQLSIEKMAVLADVVLKLLSEDGKTWFTELKKFLRKEKCWTGVIAETILRLISGDETITIDAVDGTETLADAKDVFAWRDPDLKNWGANEKGPATKETSVAVYEMEKNATFSQMFDELNADVRRLCLTQHQIKKFVKKHRKWLRTEGYATFFLFKSNDNFFVARVLFYSVASLKVRVNRFENDDVWHAEYRHRIVVPKLA